MTIRLRTLGAVAVAAAVGIAAYSLLRPTVGDADRIRAIVEEMRAAAEARKPAGVTRHVDESYRGADGMTRQQLHGMLVGWLLGAGSVGVTVLREGVRVEGAAATVTLSLLLSRDGARDARDVRLRFEKIDGDWKLVGSIGEALVR